MKAMEEAGRCHERLSDHRASRVPRQEFRSEGSLDNLGTDTDSGLSGSILGDNSKPVKRSDSQNLSEGSAPPTPPCVSLKNPDDHSLCPRGKEPPESPDGGVVLDGSGSSSPDGWRYDEEDAAPLQFKIEEHIEEVTTFHLTDDDSCLSDSSDTREFGGIKRPLRRCSFSASDCNVSDSRHQSYKRYSSTSSLNERALPRFDLHVLDASRDLEAERVPFPELGMDLLLDSSSLEDGGPSEMVLEASDWTDNWRFRRGLNDGTRPVRVCQGIDMLVPNPDTNVLPTIGDREVDELSDLSDQFASFSDQSLGEDAIPSSELFENILRSTARVPVHDAEDSYDFNHEFGQKDQEYTEDISAIARKHITKSNHCSEITPGRASTSSQLQRIIKHDMRSPKNLKTLNLQSQHHFARDRRFSPPPASLRRPRTIPDLIDGSCASSDTVWFESFPQTQLVAVGRALRISCHIRAKKYFGASWFFKGRCLDEDGDSVTWRTSAPEVHFSRFGMDEDKAGQYVLAVYTEDHCVWAKSDVLCAEQLRQSKAPIFHLALTDATGEASEDLALECQVSGHPEPKVTFYMGGANVRDLGPRYSVENDQYGTWRVRISTLVLEDAGELKAVAENGRGSAACSCLLSVNLDESPLLSKHRNSIESNRESNAESRLSSISNSENSRKKSSILASSTELKISSNSESRFPSKNDVVTQTNVRVKSSTVKKLSAPSNRKNVDVFDRFYQPPKPGTIAEREHRKWLEAKPLMNNPYSAERLAHRLQNTSSRHFSSVEAGASESSSADVLAEEFMHRQDLSRYSRDYHVNNVPKITQNVSKIAKKVAKDQTFADDHPSVAGKEKRALVRVDVARCSSDWKDDLKDIQLDVGKKVASLQKSINEWQQDWTKKYRQRSTSSKSKFVFKNTNKLSSSCMNLSSPTNVTGNAPSMNFGGQRHLIYSSSETLNSVKDNSSSLWRTASENTLNINPISPAKLSDPKMKYNNKTSSKSSSTSGVNYNQRRSSLIQNSDTDDSNVQNINRVGYLHHKFNPYSKLRKNSCYKSENSIESNRASDTEDTVSLVDSLPSVKELAQKFNSMEFLANESRANLKQNASTPSKSIKAKQIQRQYSDASSYTGQVHHSLTARHISRSFREGPRKHPNPFSPIQHQPSQNPLRSNSNTTDSHRRQSECIAPSRDKQAQTSSSRDTWSPEHLGIPSSPAYIPKRCNFDCTYPEGDTSDDSLSGFTPRKTYRKKVHNGTTARNLNDKDHSTRNYYFV